MYSSWEHFREAREGIRQLRLISNNTIIFYDLGLTPKQVEVLYLFNFIGFLQLKGFNTVCNLEIVPFPFDKWPRYAGWLQYYIFKPIIWAVSSVTVF